MSASQVFRQASVAIAVLLLAGCAREKLFQSNFDSQPTGQAPTTADIGTVATEGAVTVIAPPVTPSGRWVDISRAVADTPPASFQGNLSEVRGDGRYTFSATVFMPASTTGVATIQFGRKDLPFESIESFLHLDLMPNNQVRIDDQAGTEFGMFPRDKPFIVQVKLDIGATSTAHILLSGDGADGTADFAIPPPSVPGARQFGSVRLRMAAQHVGTLKATNIAVSRRSD